MCCHCSSFVFDLWCRVPGMSNIYRGHEHQAEERCVCMGRGNPSSARSIETARSSHTGQRRTCDTCELFGMRKNGMPLDGYMFVGRQRA